MTLISNLPDGGALRINDLIPGNMDGVTKKFSVNSLFKKGQAIYVDPVHGVDGGNTGNGSPVAPYKTISYAYSQITTNSNLNPFNIILNGGTYNETVQIFAKPFVNLTSLSKNTIINNTLPFVLDPSWAGVNGGYFSFENFNCLGVFNLDFTSIATAINPNLNLNGTSFQSQVTLKGNVSGITITSIASKFYSTFNVDNCQYFSKNNSYFSFYNACSTSTLLSSTVLNVGDIFENVLTLSGTNSGSITSNHKIRGCLIPSGLINIQNLNTTVNIDASSYSIPTISGSPTIEYATISDGINANYIPTNYTPTNPELKGHLEGIDAALGDATMLPQSNIVYVSTYGNDTTGEGTQEKPFASLFKAMTHLSTLVSPSNPYAVCLDPGQYNESNSVPIIPNVAVYATEKNTSVIFNNGVSISTLWNNGNVFNNLFWENISFASPLNIDFSTSTNTTVTNRVYFNNCQFLFDLNLNGSSQNSPFYNTEFYLTNCQNILLPVSSDNCYVYIQGGDFGSVLNFGTNTATCQCEFDLLSTICQKLNINATSGSFSTAGTIESSKFSLASTISGSTTTIFADASLWSAGNPTITSANVVRKTKSNGILTNNTTPFINFTPTDTSVLGALQGIDAALGFATGVKTNDVWVSNQGSNTTGIGTIEKPYQTINYALSQITTNSSTNVFKIICTSGIYNENAMVLKPFVYIDGQGSTLNVIGSINADSTFNTIGGNIVFGNFFNCNISGSFNFDVSSGTQPVGIYIYNFLYEGNLALIVKGNNSSSFPTYCVINNVESSLGLIPVTLENVYGYVDACTFSTFSYLANNPNIFYSFDSYGTTYFGGSGISISSVSPSGVLSTWSNNNITSSSFSVNGATQLKIDVSSCQSNNIPIATGGATVSYVNVADTLEANYTPTNYIPVNGTVKGHLQGINNKLATVGLDSLQSAYNNGVNATITGVGGKSINFTMPNPALSSVYDTFGNGQQRFLGLPVPNPTFTNPPLSTSTNSTVDNYGFFFKPNFNLHGVKVGFLATELPTPSSSRLIGIFRQSDNLLIASTTVTGISALDANNRYRTEFISDVFLSTADIYFVQAVYPSGSTIRNGVPTGIDPNISILGTCSAINQPILTYPTVITNIANNVLGSAVLFESLNTSFEVAYIGSQGIKNLYSVTSTTFPVVLSFTGFSSVLLTSSHYQRIGNIISMQASLSCTPNSTNGNILLLVPYSSGWTNINTDVTGVGTIIDPNNPTRVTAVSRINASGSNPQAVSVTTGVTAPASGNVHLLKLSFMYTANAV